MSDIDRIMHLIDWNRSLPEQMEGISMAREVACIKAFFQPKGPGYGKNVWDNCAVVVCERTDEELNPYIRDMLLWLEDLNWPGAQQIQSRLTAFRDVSMLSMYLNGMVPALSLLREDSWLMFLADLLDNPKLKDSVHPDTLAILSRYRDGVKM